MGMGISAPRSGEGGAAHGSPSHSSTTRYANQYKMVRTWMLVITTF